MALFFRFLVTNIVTHYDGDDKVIVVTTDVPAHLLMRFQEKGIVVHGRIKSYRGIWLTTDPHLGFDNYLEIQQEEPGKTLSHTFVYPNWQPCQTIYFRFASDPAVEPSPSETPVFSQHRPMPWTGEPDGFFGWVTDPNFMLVAVPNIIEGVIATPTEDCYPVKLAARYQDLSGDYSRTKMALYDKNRYDSELIATTEERWLDPLFDGWAEYYTSNFPLLKAGTYYAIVFWTTSPLWRRYYGGSTFDFMRAKDLGYYGFWPAPMPMWGFAAPRQCFKCYYTLKKPPG